MPPPPIPASSPSSDHDSSVVTINVGGQLFQTTPQTLSLAGASSVLSSLRPSRTPFFFDRDPALFSSLLSLLRSPSSRSSISPDLIPELQFFAVDPQHLLAATKFDPFALQKSLLLPLHGRDLPSALAVHASSGAVHVAHAGKIASFDPTLSRRSTVLTPLPAIDSLLPVSHSLLAAGAADFPSLHLIDIPSGRARHTLDWHPGPPNASPAAVVQAVGSSPELLFASFESSRRTASAVLAFDLATFLPVAEIGRKEIFGAELDSAIPATKLKWSTSFNLLMAAGSHSGPSGLVGNIRLWDVRSGKTAWEITEMNDCFAAVTISDELKAIFKVGMNSGEMYIMDLRKLSGGGRAEMEWACLGDARKKEMASGRKEGSGCRIESYGEYVFLSKGGEVEMWAAVEMAGGERVIRRNLMGRMKDAAGERIVRMEFGGNRMVVVRKEQHCIEVWQNSN